MASTMSDHSRHEEEYALPHEQCKDGKTDIILSHDTAGAHTVPASGQTVPIGDQTVPPGNKRKHHQIIAVKKKCGMAVKKTLPPIKRVIRKCLLLPNPRELSLLHITHVQVVLRLTSFLRDLRVYRVSLTGSLSISMANIA